MYCKASDIRRDMVLLEQVMLGEKFVKESDPTMAVCEFLQAAGANMSAIQRLYNDKAKDRNEIVKPVLDMLDELISVATVTKETLMGMDSPEDTNKILKDG